MAPNRSTSPLWAYCLPFAIFLVVGSFEPSGPEARLYPLIYAVKVALVSLAWVYFRAAYPPWSTNGWAPGIAAGVIGALVWIGLCRVDPLPPLLAEAPDGVRQFLTAERVGFDPFAALDGSASQWGFIAIRLLGLAIVAPLAEEIFLRGFLLRYLIRPDFTNVAEGSLTMLSAVATTALFTLTHPEKLAAFAWALLFLWLWRRTKSLWACIIGHMTTNLLLGLYVLVTGEWDLW